MKIVFLDIDGVVNTPSAELGFHNMGESWRELYKNPNNEQITRLNAYAHVFSPSCLWYLSRIIQETGAKIVISSTWRLKASLEEMKGWFADPIISEAIIGKTDHFYGDEYAHLRDHEGRIQRGEEILDWVKKHPEVTRYAVLDDDGDMDAVRSNFFQTEGMDGINYKIYKKVVNHLNYTKRIENHHRLNVAINGFYAELYDCLECLSLEEKELLTKKITDNIQDLIGINDKRRQEKYRKEAEKRE